MNGVKVQKVAIYARVSTGDQSLDAQVQQCLEHCKRMNWEVYEIYRDVISGSKESRPGFNKMLDAMRHYKYHVIMVTKLDRIGRSMKHMINLFEEFDRKGVNFVATTQPIDTTSPTGRLLFQIMAAFAEFERNIISERTKEGLRHAKNVGKRGKDKKPRLKRGGRRNSLGFLN